MDHGAFMDSDTCFHLGIAHAARNPIFETVGSTIQSILRIWYPKTYYIPEIEGRAIAASRDRGPASPQATWTPRAKRGAHISSLRAALAHPSAGTGNARIGSLQVGWLQERVERCLSSQSGSPKAPDLEAHKVPA
jgi:hypothetical protein